MVGVYFHAVRRQLRTFSSIPSHLKPEVRQRLIDEGYEHLIDE